MAEVVGYRLQGTGYRPRLPESGRLAIKNGNVLLGRDIRVSDVLIEDESIVRIGAGAAGDREIDAEGCYVLPGLIDLHTHGIGFESAVSDSLREYAALEASYGATTFYPTFFSRPEDTAAHMLRHRLETNELRELPQIGGFRLESPYLARVGGGGEGTITPISQENTQMLLEAGGGHTKIWDVSPELPGALDLIAELTRLGVVCSMAHTSATPELARAAVDAGLKLVTHLFDTFEVPEMTDPGVYPAGLTDYLLVEDRLVCEILADGLHVHPLLVEKAFRCKTGARIAVVTDSNTGAGLPPGRYTLPGGWGDVIVNGCNDGVRLAERGMGLAGSALTPIDAFRNVARMFGKGIAAAVQVCSTTPAQLMKLQKGEVAVGKDADIIILDADLEVLYTIARGTIVYHKGDSECPKH